jgi:hypothetical protein
MTKTHKIILVILVIVLIIIVALIPKNTASKAPTEKTASSTVETIASLQAKLPSNMLYVVGTDKSSYKQDELIHITLTVTNNTKEKSAFSFKNGCQGNYTIETFNLAPHTQCLPNASSFVMEPGETRKISMAHYPSLYKIPVGQHTLTASVIGYGSASLTINITN